MTQNQLIELLESEQVRALIERAEERGYVEPAELEAFAVEHDLAEDELELFTRELETIGLELAQPAAASAEADAEAAKEAAAEQVWEADSAPGAADSLQLFLADVSSLWPPTR